MGHYLLDDDQFDRRWKFFSKNFMFTVDSRRIAPCMFFRVAIERRIGKFANVDAFEQEKEQEHDN